MQRVMNPCPRVEHPIWLQRSITERASGRKQVSILSALSTMRIASASAEAAKLAAVAAAAPRMLSEGSGSGKAIKSILAGETAEDGSSKPKKRVRIQLEGEVDPDAASGASPTSTAAAAAGGSIPDLEDFGSAASTALTGVARVATFKPTGSTAADVTDMTAAVEKVAITPLNELPDGKHATAGDFNAWLADRKSRWKSQREARKQQRRELQQYGTAGGAPGAKKAVGVADLVRNASLAATMGFWQVGFLSSSQLDDCMELFGA